MLHKIVFLVLFFVFQGSVTGISHIIDTITSCFTMKEQCPSDKVTFWLYTRENMDMPHELIYGDMRSLETAPFVRDQPIFITIHGYTGSRDSAPNKQLKPALLVRGDYNVIAVDYNSTVKSPCYLHSPKNVRVAANCTAQFLDFLLQNMNISLEQIHVIGFSLGAHVSGMLADFIQTGKLKHITGLDPALPLFLTIKPDEKLDKTDAEFVDVIHTNALYAGKLEPSGDVDFYVNGGNGQPGCETLNGISVCSYICIHAVEIKYISCDHNRAPMYYSESINTKIGFYGRKFPRTLCALGIKRCDLMIMGFDVPHTARGIYTVETSDEPPFALGKPE